MAGVTALSWSALAIALKFSLNFASSGTIAFIRFVVAAACLAVLLWFFKREQFKAVPKIPKLIYVAGVGLALNYLGYMKGIEYTSPSNAQIFIQMSQVMFVGVGLFYFKEQLRNIQKLGFMIAICGFGLFYYDQTQQAHTFKDTFALGVFWLFIGSITWVVFATIQKIISQHWHPQSINLLIYPLCALLLAPLANFSEILQWSPDVWALMIVLGLNTVIAYGALGYALQLAPANQVSLIISCNPILTIIFMQILSSAGAQWIVAEKMGLASYAGAAIVVCGVSLAVQRFRRRVDAE